MNALPKTVSLLVALLFAAAAICVIAGSEDSSATAIGTLNPHDFKDNSNGTLDVTVLNTEAADIVITLTVKEGDNALAETTQTVSGGTTVVKISFKLGAGDHTVTVYATAELDDGSHTPVSVSGSGTLSTTISVEKSIWSGWVPYVVLAIVGIIVVLMIFIWYRGRPKSKPAVTFTDLEEGRVTEEAKPTETAKKRYEAAPAAKEDKSEASTGRIKYKSDRRK